MKKIFQSGSMHNSLEKGLFMNVALFPITFFSF